MADLPQECGSENCSEPRVQFSVFCASHHREALVKVGLASPNPERARCEAVQRMIVRYSNSYRSEKISSQEFLDNVILYLIGKFAHGMWEFPAEIFESLPSELEEAFGVLLQSKADDFSRAFVRDFNDPAECAAATRMAGEALACLRSAFAKHTS